MTTRNGGARAVPVRRPRATMNRRRSGTSRSRPSCFSPELSVVFDLVVSLGSSESVEKSAAAISQRADANVIAAITRR